MIDAWIYDALDELYMSRSLSPALQVCQRYRLLFPIQRDLQWVGTVGQLRYLWECLGEDGGSLKTFAKQFIRGNGQRFSYKALKNHPSIRLSYRVLRELRKLGCDCR